MYRSGEEDDELEITKPKKHTIKSRKKAIGKWALNQVADASLAAGVVLLLNAMPIYSFQTTAAITLGALVFVATKGVKALVRFGKKHIIKKRTTKKEKSGSVKTALGISACLLPILALGPKPIVLMASGAAAIVLLKKRKKMKDKSKDKDSGKGEDKDKESHKKL